MARAVYVLTCFAGLMAVSEAKALQLTNRDTTDHKISLTEKGSTQELLVKPSQVVDGICTAGCTMKMADGEEYEFDGNEVVSIEEGLMFLDEPADGSSAGGTEDPAGTDDPAAAETGEADPAGPDADPEAAEKK